MMKKFFCKGFLLGILLAVVSIPVVVDAYATFNRHRMINGVGNYGRSTQYYYIEATAKGEGNRIRNAMNKWVNSNGLEITTPISFRETTNRSSSVIDFQKTSAVNGGAAGITYWYINSADINPNGSNWYWNNIYLLKYYDYLSSWQKDLTCAHEIGHAFGLAHVTNNNRVMNQYGDNTRVNGPTLVELMGINSLYK